MTTITLTPEMEEWLHNGERGISSGAIFEALAGIPIISSTFDHSTPRDPSDFYRCYKLLKAVPDFRERILEVGEKFPNWKPMVTHWDELESLLVEEMNRTDGKAPKLYARIKELNDESD